jgi:hypothetical protein
VNRGAAELERQRSEPGTRYADPRLSSAHAAAARALTSLTALPAKMQSGHSAGWKATADAERALPVLCKPCIDLRTPMQVAVGCVRSAS